MDPVSIENELLAAVAGIRTYQRDGDRAPHKPLLLLFMLGRIQNGAERLVSFLDAEPKLRALLLEFGSSTRARPEYPFYHLSNDGLWDLPDMEGLPRRTGGQSYTARVLRDNGVHGGLDRKYDEVLRNDPILLRRTARQILDEHFPSSLHADILTAVGLDLHGSVPNGKRDPEFRNQVLLGYGYSCAVCGLDPHVNGSSSGLEAAHVQWHSHGGPSTPDNGVCLCPLHHKALDLGILAIDDQETILVSSRVTGGDAVQQFLLRFHGHRVRGRREKTPPVNPVYARWHAKQVFKGPAL